MSGISAPEGVVVPDDLANLRMGLLSISEQLQYFYCLSCSACLPGICLANHLNGIDHISTRPQHIRSQLSAAIKKYQSVVQWSNPIQLPNSPIPWIPALEPPLLGHQCSTCFEPPHPVWFDRKQHSKHFVKNHPATRFRHGDEGYFQNLFSPRYAKAYYGVFAVTYDPNKVALDDISDPSLQDSWAVCLADLPKPSAPPLMPAIIDNIDTSPYLSDVRWASHVSGFNIQDLQRLVELPSPEDLLYPIRVACQQLFVKHLEAISQGSSVLRQIWTTGSYHPQGEREFTVITASTIPKYCNKMVGIVCWILRMAQRLSSDEQNDPALYCCPLDKSQLACANQVLDALADSTASVSSSQPGSRCHPQVGTTLATSSVVDPLMVQQLLMACFTPERKSFARRNTLNAFHDPVHVYCMLAAIQNSGQFAEPILITSPLAATQYIIRSTLFYHLIMQLDDPDCDIDQLAHALHNDYLSQNQLTPWGNLQALKHTTWTHAQNSSPSPTVQWVCDTEANVKGKVVGMDRMKILGRNTLSELRSILYEGLLFGLDLKNDLGFKFDQSTTLVDDLSCKTPGYSVFSDRKNIVFSGLDTKLYEAVVKHPKLTGVFYKKVDSRKKPAFLYSKRIEWLRLVSFFSSKLACAMHVLGGQPGRRSEFLVQYIFNRIHRLRNLMWFRDVLIFVLFYSKITQTTGKDRVIAHGLPWELTEILVPFITLVRPLAVIWVRELHGDTRADIQSDYLFAQQGAVLSAHRFSSEFEAITEKNLGTKINISEWRHLIIAVMRKLFSIEMDVPEDEDNMDDLEMQAGHTAQMAKRTYGLLESREWNQLKDDTTLKWIKASKVTYEWFLNSALSNPASATFLKSAPAASLAVAQGEKRKQTQNDEFIPDRTQDDPAPYLTVATRRSARLKPASTVSKVQKLVFDCVELPKPKRSSRSTSANRSCL